MLDHAQGIAAAMVEKYFTGSAVPPQFCEELWGDLEEDWEALKKELAPEIDTLERRHDYLYVQLHTRLMIHAERQLLRDFDDLWVQLRLAEADAAFLLGIALGKWLADSLGSEDQCSEGVGRAS
jgi:hypothetical protein